MFGMVGCGGVVAHGGETTFTAWSHLVVLRILECCPASLPLSELESTLECLDLYSKGPESDADFVYHIHKNTSRQAAAQ